jgi:hypothetical protein
MGHLSPSSPPNTVATGPANRITLLAEMKKMIARPWNGFLLVIAACAAVAVSGLTGCGSESNNVSAASLKPRLLPASLAPGFTVLRTLDWSDPVDLVGEGLFLPQITQPSQAVKEIRNAGFRGAAGEDLNRGGPTGDEIRTGVIKFKSASAAEKVRDWLHSEDLQQPCFAQCIFSPRNLTISGIPGVKAVRQVPTAAASGPPPGVKLPPGVKPPNGATNGPPTRYLFEFTVGPYLYFASTEGGAGTRARFATGARGYYNRVKGLDES